MGGRGCFSRVIAVTPRGVKINPATPGVLGIEWLLGGKSGDPRGPLGGKSCHPSGWG